MEVNDTRRAPATVPASALAVAADDHFELRAAATRVALVWGELQEQLGELQHITSEQRYRDFAANLHRLRLAMVELATLLRATS